jgi:hypothetical protein
MISYNHIQEICGLISPSERNELSYSVLTRKSKNKLTKGSDSNS